MKKVFEKNLKKGRVYTQTEKSDKKFILDSIDLYEETIRFFPEDGNCDPYISWRGTIPFSYYPYNVWIDVTNNFKFGR